MKTRNHSNALLLELLIVVMFFMLAATVLLQVFAKARSMGEEAGRTASAVAEAQSRADRLYAAEDPEKALREMGFAAEQDQETWVLREETAVTTVTLSREDGGLTRQRLTVRDTAGTTLADLPCSRWREVSP